MRYGVCVGINSPEYVKFAAECGFDYIECGFSLFANATEDQLAEWEETSQKSNIKCEACNCFLPNSLPVTGENVDYDALYKYVENGMKNGSRLGLKTVVFGSSGARNLPEGFPFAKGFYQMGYFLREIASPIAQKYGITVVTEPLSAAESNIINTVNEGIMLSVLADRDNIKGLADIYHMQFAGDKNEDIARAKGTIVHGHISYPIFRNGKNRTYPADISEFDYKSFIDALKTAGCKRCSVEAAVIDFYEDAAKAIKVLKSL